MVTLSTRLAPGWRRTPFTYTYLSLLGIGSIVLSLLNPGDHDGVLQASSTDVDHLAAHPIFALISSAFWVDGIADYVIAALILGAVAAVLERRIGTRWVIAVFASGHVVATLVTEGSIALGVRSGFLASGALSRIDVGISYGLAATMAAAAGLLPGRVKLLGVLAAWIYLGLPLAGSQDMTSWGHVVALGIGISWWPLLQRRGVGSKNWAKLQKRDGLS